MRWFDNLRVRVKVLLAIGIVLALTLTVGVTGLVSISHLNANTQEVTDNWMPSVATLQRITIASGDLRAADGRLFSVTSAQAAAQSRKDIATYTSEIAQDRSIYRKLISSPAEGRLYRTFSDQWAAYLQLHEKVLAAVAANQRGQAAGILAGPGEVTYAKARVTLGKLVALNTRGAAHARRSADSMHTEARTAMLIALIGSLAVGVAMALVAARSISAPLGRAVAALGRVADGHLGSRLTMDRRDEIGDLSTALDTALDKLVAMMRRVNEGADALAAASEELSTTSSQMSASAEESATTAQDVAESVGGITQNVQSMATGSEQMTASIEEIARNAQDASAVAAEAVGTVQDTTTTMRTLETAAAQIGDVLGMISSIAEQTNLLALNATIEAARAGDAGKGFAVVASEVKDLAQETARATEQITQQVLAIQGKTTTASAGMGTVESVMTRIQDYTTTIAGAVEEQTATTAELGRSANGAATNTDAVNGSIGVVAAAAAQISASASATHGAATELAQLAAQLRTSVGSFQLD